MVRGTPTILSKAGVLLHPALADKFRQGSFYSRARKAEFSGHGTYGIPALTALAGPVKLNDYLALTQLKKVDEETRAYLAQHLQPDDYETIDGYFAKQGLYASDSLKYTDLSQSLPFIFIISF